MATKWVDITDYIYDALEQLDDIDELGRIGAENLTRLEAAKQLLRDSLEA